MTHNHKENPSIKTNQEMAKIMEIAVKEFLKSNYSYSKYAQGFK